MKLQEPLSKCLKNWINDATSRDVVVGDYCYLSHKERAMTYSGVLLKFDWIMKEPAMVLKSLKLKSKHYA